MRLIALSPHLVHSFSPDPDSFRSSPWFIFPSTSNFPLTQHNMTTHPSLRMFLCPFFHFGISIVRMHTCRGHPFPFIVYPCRSGVLISRCRPFIFVYFWLLWMRCPSLAVAKKGRFPCVLCLELNGSAAVVCWFLTHLRLFTIVPNLFLFSTGMCYVVGVYFFSSSLLNSVSIGASIFFRNFMPRGYGYQSIWNFSWQKTNDFQKLINLGISKAGYRISCWEDTNWPCVISTKRYYIWGETKPCMFFYLYLYL